MVVCGMSKLSLTTAVAALFLAATAAFSETAPVKSYFSGWAGAEAELPAAPAALGVTVAKREGEEPHEEHNPVVHMALARRAYALYASRYSGSELGKYIGDYKGEKPPSGHNTVVAGSYEEDKPYLNPFDEAVSVMRHFWDCRQSDETGLMGYDSSVNRAQKYWTGGYGLNGAYDPQWSAGRASRRGEKGAGALALHRRGEKSKAYWYLGHAAHLLQDATIPAHVLLWPHPLHGDSYESYVRENHLNWPSVPSRPIEAFANVRELFAATCVITNRYDAGTKEGGLYGLDGVSDMGRRRAGGFSPEELREEGDVLVPLAIRRVASLFVLFYKELDHDAPRVTLRAREDAGAVALAAFAVDDLSGVDVTGYRYEWRRAGAAHWAPAEAVFLAPEAGDYEFRAGAVDAAGNAAWSKPRAVRVGAARLLVRN